MTIFIAADHRGFDLKNAIIEYLHEKNIRIEDLGAYEKNMEDDYPDYAKKVAQAVLQNLENNLGIVICGSGVGVAIACNRFKNIRAGVAFLPDQVKHTRENDHINILSLPADYLSVEEAYKIVDAFLEALPKNEEKYLRRIKKLDEL